MTSSPISEENAVKGEGHHSWLASRWRAFLVFCLVVLVPFILFFSIGVRVRDGNGFSWDALILQTVHTHSTPARDAIMVFTTHRGSGLEIGVVAGMVLVALALRRCWKDASFLMIAMAGVGLANQLAKFNFQRTRPHLWESPAPELDYGFPSGHAMMSFGLALALAIITWRTRWRWAVIIIGTGFVLAVGLSRAYLGVHYPSDVLAGWLLSLAWVAAAAFVRSGPVIAKRLLATPTRQCAAYGLMLILLPVAYTGRVLCEDNFRIITPGQAYRSGQMNSKNLRRVVQD